MIIYDTDDIDCIRGNPLQRVIIQMDLDLPQECQLLKRDFKSLMKCESFRVSLRTPTIRDLASPSWIRNQDTVSNQ